MKKTKKTDQESKLENKEKPSKKFKTYNVLTIVDAILSNKILKPNDKGERTEVKRARKYLQTCKNSVVEYFPFANDDFYLAVNFSTWQ